MGSAMIRKSLVAVSALAAIAAFTITSQPAEAGGCTVVSAKSRGLSQSGVSDRSQNKLNRKIDHWARKNGLTVVRVGYVSTVCSTKGALAVCTSSAKVCP